MRFSSSDSKRQDTMKLGADEYYLTEDAKSMDSCEPLNHLLITASGQPDYALLMSKMATNGKIYPLTVSFGTTPVPMVQFIFKGISLVGGRGSTRAQAAARWRFVAKNNIKPIVQKFPLTADGINKAVETIESGEIRYRAVLEIE